METEAHRVQPCLWFRTFLCLGPILTSSCAIWCDNTRLSEELIECHIGSFVQVHIKALCASSRKKRCNQRLHQKSMWLLAGRIPSFWPGRHGACSLEKVWMDRCRSGHGKALMKKGRRVYPGKNPDTMIFHRVHKSIEEVCPVLEPAVKHFILADSEEQEHTRTVVFAIFAAKVWVLWRKSLDPCYPGVGIYWTCVEAREGGLFITTISGSNIRKSWFNRGISLPVMSDVTATRCYWRIARFHVCVRGYMLLLVFWICRVAFPFLPAWKLDAWPWFKC